MEKKYTDIDLPVPATFTVTPIHHRNHLMGKGPAIRQYVQNFPESVRKIGVYDADERRKLQQPSDDFATKKLPAFLKGCCKRLKYMAATNGFEQLTSSVAEFGRC